MGPEKAATVRGGGRVELDACASDVRHCQKRSPGRQVSRPVDHVLTVGFRVQLELEIPGAADANGRQGRRRMNYAGEVFAEIGQGQCQDSVGRRALCVAEALAGRGIKPLREKRSGRPVGERHCLVLLQWQCRVGRSRRKDSAGREDIDQRFAVALQTDGRR